MLAPSQDQPATAGQGVPVDSVIMLWGVRSPRSHLLALTAWLKCYQRLGDFPKLADVPEVVVEHLRQLLELAPDVDLSHDADRTAKWHPAA